MTITVTALSDEYALYRQGRGETRPRPVYVYLDPSTEEMYAVCEVSDGVPVDVWHRRRLRWSIPPLTGEAVEDLMQRIVPLAERIVAGHEIVWDGSNQVGRLDADASQADDEIACLCHTCDGEQVASLDCWEFMDALGPKGAAAAYGISAESTDEELEAAADKAQDDASDAGIHVLRQANEYFDWLRESLKADVAEVAR